MDVNHDSTTLIALSPAYWIPVLTLVLLILVFLAFMFHTMIKLVMKPLQHTLDQMNETMKELVNATGRLNERIAIVMDRRREERPDAAR